MRHQVGSSAGVGVRLTTVALLALCGLTVAACGARWSDAQKTELLARGERGERPGAVSDDASSSRPAVDAAAGAEVKPSNGPTVPTTSGGSAGSPGAAAAAGGEPSTGAAGEGALPCAAPSTEKGVTDSTIAVGEISSLSGPVPGLGASAAAATRAYVAYLNANGGVCGRQIELKEADDGTDIARYRSALRELEPQVLGITGGFAVGDIGAEDTINSLKIPIVNTPTGRTGELRWVFDINPDFPRPDMEIGKYRYLYEQGARKVALAYIAVDNSRLETNIQRGLMEAAGLEIVDVNELPLATLSYDSAARRAANSGANYLWFISDASGQASMARAVADTGFDWKFKEFSYTSYGTTFLELAGSSAEGVTSWLRSLPTEEAGTNEAMARYVEWMSRVAPGADMDLFSIDSYVSTVAFFDALQALPGPITREAVVQELETFEDFDAGGMFAPITLGQDLSKGCFMAMIVRDGKWERLTPASGFLC